MREGKAKVLNDRELSRAANAAKKKAHAKRNVALLYVSFGLGLRAKEMAALKLKHVLDTDHMLLDEINLTGAMTKGRKQRHVYVTNAKVAGALKDYIDERLEEDGSLFNLEAPLFRSQKGSSFTPNTMQQLFHRMYVDLQRNLTHFAA